MEPPESAAQEELRAHPEILQQGLAPLLVMEAQEPPEAPSTSVASRETTPASLLTQRSREALLPVEKWEERAAREEPEVMAPPAPADTMEERPPPEEPEATAAHCTLAA